MTNPYVEGTRSTYDQVAVQYDKRSRDTTAPFDAFRAWFAEGVTNPVADLGCGPGRDLEFLRAAGLAVVGVDLSEGMLAVARQVGLPVVLGDLRQPPLAPGSLGGIWSTAALLHVPRPDVPSTLAAWRLLLRPGGRLGLSTSIDGKDGWEPVPYATELQRWFVHHDLDELLQLVGAAGFTILGYEIRTSHRTWAQIRAVAS